MPLLGHGARGARARLAHQSAATSCLVLAAVGAVVPAHARPWSVPGQARAGPGAWDGACACASRMLKAPPRAARDAAASAWVPSGGSRGAQRRAQGSFSRRRMRVLCWPRMLGISGPCKPGGLVPGRADYRPTVGLRPIALARCEGWKARGRAVHTLQVVWLAARTLRFPSRCKAFGLGMFLLALCACSLFQGSWLACAPLASLPLPRVRLLLRAPRASGWPEPPRSPTTPRS